MKPASLSWAPVTTSQPPTAREQLRSSTERLHRLLDSQFDLASLPQPEVYQAFLLAHWPFASIEPALEDAGIAQLLPDWDVRSRRKALQADLRFYGISPPDTMRLEIGSDRGTLFGWSYVLEGSRLGAGMILHKFLRPGGEAARSTEFLRHGSGEHLWKSFTSALSTIDNDPFAISKACSAANLAFQCFLQGKSQWDTAAATISLSRVETTYRPGPGQ